ncbi:hypothetical protein BC830DRAFT_548663 [Chytriomyces sp. MP71]|nr:hypothetical protein BC830DRAFT_548663 [Chytriomyces sp. MP71]
MLARQGSRLNLEPCGRGFTRLATRQKYKQFEKECKNSTPPQQSAHNHPPPPQTYFTQLAQPKPRFPPELDQLRPRHRCPPPSKKHVEKLSKPVLATLPTKLLSPCTASETPFDVQAQLRIRHRIWASHPRQRIFLLMDRHQFQKLRQSLHWSNLRNQKAT